jgi:hypothetical protein
MPREWGNPLWKILHSITESLGNQKNTILSADEAHEIVFLLRDLEKVMPCQLCRQHYNKWRKEHPLEKLSVLRGPALRDAVRKWLYELHENVNQDRKLESNITIEQLPELYKSVDIRTEWGKFFEQMKTSTEVGLVSQLVLQNFHRHLGILRKLLGR